MQIKDTWEHFMVRFKRQTGEIPSNSICETWIDKNRKTLRYIYRNSVGEAKAGAFGDLRPKFWDNIEFLYEIDDGQEWILNGIF